MKMKPSKTKIFLWKFIPIIQRQKELNCGAKVIEGPEATRILTDSVVYRFPNNKGPL